MPADYRPYVLPSDHPRVTGGRGLDPVAYSAPILATPRAIALAARWDALLAAPYVGVTRDGQPEPDLYPLEDQGFDPAPAVDAMRRLLALLDAPQRAAACKPLDAAEWRAWYNPELVFNQNGTRMEHFSPAAQRAFLDLLASCTSARGFEKIRRLMKANLFLGELYDLRQIMSEWTYHFQVFGTPDPVAPWGWQVYGHHIGFHVLILGRQMVIAPLFMGTEPNEITLHSGESFTLFAEEEAEGLALMQALPPALQAKAQIYAHMEDPAMPPSRFNFADQRHLGGAFQDNRIIPCEGVCAAAFPPDQRAALLRLCERFHDHWPDGPRQARMAQIAAHLDRTWFAWIGGFGADDPFYYHIHSPVLMLEFDHHSGMWLTNAEPAKFHIHLIARLPNGNDYGKALIAAQRAQG